MDQEQYEKQHDYLNRMAEVPTKLMTLNKELDLLLHHASDIAAKLTMLDDMILKARDVESRLSAVQYFLADDIKPIPTSPRDETATTLASDVKSETDRAELHYDYHMTTAPRGGIKHGRTI